jgi:hypothetical protein
MIAADFLGPDEYRIGHAISRCSAVYGEVIPDAQPHGNSISIVHRVHRRVARERRGGLGGAGQAERGHARTGLCGDGRQLSTASPQPRRRAWTNVTGHSTSKGRTAAIALERSNNTGMN